MDNDKITVFYNKRLGRVKEIVSGNQTFDWFGDEKEDYMQIYDLMIVDDDGFIWQNYNDMVVVDGALKLSEPKVPKKFL